jgi:hypothetical protein
MKLTILNYLPAVQRVQCSVGNRTHLDTVVKTENKHKYRPTQISEKLRAMDYRIK